LFPNVQTKALKYTFGANFAPKSTMTFLSRLKPTWSLKSLLKAPNSNPHPLVSDSVSEILSFVNKVDEALPDSAVKEAKAEHCTFVHVGLERIDFESRRGGDDGPKADLGQQYEVTKR
jgi:hypothetical protein